MASAHHDVVSETDLSLGLNTGFPKPSIRKDRSSAISLKFDHEFPSLSLAPLADQFSASAGSSSYSNANAASAKPTPDQETVSDDDEEEEASPRKKLRLTKDQAAVLEQSFKQHSTLNPSQKQTLARQLNLRPRQVEVWFQNRRARTKLKQTEMESEQLKKSCKALTEENKRLNRELQELKALKLAAPGYVQALSPAFSMCPSCGRFTGAASPVSDDHRFAASAGSAPSFYSMNGAKTPQLFTHSSAAC